MAEEETATTTVVEAAPAPAVDTRVDCFAHARGPAPPEVLQAGVDQARKCTACSKPVAEHGSNKWAVECKTCHKFFVGACSGVRKSDRGLYERDGWTCAPCLRSLGPLRRTHITREGPAPVAATTTTTSTTAAAPAATTTTTSATAAAPAATTTAARTTAAAPALAAPAAEAATGGATAAVAAAVAATPAKVPFDKLGELFRCAQVPRPYLAALKGDAVLNLCIAPTPPEDFQGLAGSVQARHRMALRKLQDQVRRDATLQQVSLVAAILETLRRACATRKWAAATLHREMGNLAGAWSKLEMYTDSPVNFKLGEDASWKDAMKAAQLKMSEEQQAQPASTYEQVARAIAAPNLEPTVMVALALTWAVAGRLGDVLKLQRQDVQFEPTFNEDGKMRVKFSRGKGARFNAPYDLATTLPAAWRAMTRQYVEAHPRPREWLFPGGYSAVGVLASAALRRVDRSFTVRALRRGALQTMAKAGVPLDTLRRFAGHAQESTTLRYLNWGHEAGGLVAAGQAAATLLDGSGASEQHAQPARAAMH